MPARAFMRSTRSRPSSPTGFPNSTLLSHDLFEGVFARAGLASDVEVVESYPTRYDVASLRYHRWARGDWQLLPWILGWSALLGSRARLPARMPSSGRWKMVDNLRRSVTPLTCVLALLAGWALPFDAALVWTLFFLGTIALPSLSPVLASAGARHPGIRARVHFARILADLGSALAQILLIVTLLAHQAWLMADAVVRTLFRLFITRRNLLQWTPAAQATIGRDPGLGAYYRWMAGAVLTGAAAIAGTWLFGDRTVLPGRAVRAPVDRLARGRAMGEPAVERGGGAHVPSEGDRRALRLIARRTWRYLRDLRHARRQHASAGQFPGGRRRRCSPIAPRRPISASISCRRRARMISAGRAPSTRSSGSRRPWRPWRSSTDIEAISTTGTTRESLRALDPQYVSSVDSGNLAGHLIALANACQDWCETPIEDARRLAGIGRCSRASCAKRSKPCATAGARKPSPGVSSTSPWRISSPKRTGPG